MLVIDSRATIRDRRLFTTRGATIMGLDFMAKKMVFALDDAMVLNVDTLVDFVNAYGNDRFLIFGFTFMIWYMGSGKIVPGYNVMGVAKAALEASVRYLAFDLGPRGIRVNALSAGPIKTLAASAVSSLKDIFHYVEKNAPLRRNVTPLDVGGAAVFLASDLSCAVTGEIIYVDSGFSQIGVA